MAEVTICASCPESHQEKVAKLCLEHGIQKAFGKAGDMVDSLKGKDWIPKWEAKVVMATVTKAQTLGLNHALLICIAGGKHCDAEMARQPALVRAIKTEMANPNFRVRVEWLEIDAFLDRYPSKSGGNSSVGKGNKGNKGADTAAGKGKGKKSGTEAPAQHGQGYGNGQDAKKESCAAPGKGNSKKGNTEVSAQKGQGNTNGQEKRSQKPSQVVCKYWLQGHCRNGNACMDLHADSAAVAGSKQMCAFYARGCCKNGAACKFSHAGRTRWLSMK